MASGTENLSVSMVPTAQRHAGLARATNFSASIDAVVVATIVVVGTVLFGTFQYKGELSEPDLYIALIGLLNGQETGLGLDDPLQYGRAFSYGYIEFIEAAARVLNIHGREATISLINNVGLVSAVAGLGFMYLCLRVAYGSAIAIVAIVLIGLSPMFMDLATSGHPLLPAFCLFAAGGLLLLIDTSGWLRIGTLTAAALILFAGLTVRAEILFGFPWLVLAQSTPPQSARHYIRTVGWRSVACLLATGLFFLGRFLLVPEPAGDERGLAGLSVFFQTWYSWAKVGPGLVYLLLGCGIVTIIVAGVCALIEIKSLLSARFSQAALQRKLPFLAPLALVVPGLLFWIANPAPSRHFFFFMVGVAICIGLSAISTLKLSKASAVALAFTVVAANQMVAESARSLVVRVMNSPLTNLPDTTRTPTLVPLGFFWKHHEILQSRREAFSGEASKIRTACDPFVLVLTEEPHHLVAALFTEQLKPKNLTVTTMGAYGGYSTEFGGRHFLFIVKSSGWPEDALSHLLSVDALSKYQIYVDPYGVTSFDHTPVPVSRKAKFGC